MRIDFLSDLTSDELFELRWIFEELLTSSFSCSLTPDGSIDKMSAGCIKPSLFLSLYKKIIDDRPLSLKLYQYKLDCFQKKFNIEL